MRNKRSIKRAFFKSKSLKFIIFEKRAISKCKQISTHFYVFLISNVCVFFFEYFVFIVLRNLHSDAKWKTQMRACLFYPNCNFLLASFDSIHVMSTIKIDWYYLKNCSNRWQKLKNWMRLRFCLWDLCVI